MKNILFFICIIISSLSFSQVSFTGYLVDSEEEKLKDVEVNLYQGNEKVSTTLWSKKFEYNLDLEKYYTLELIKEGFISKKIAISTIKGDKDAEPFLFVMELIKKSKEIKGVDSDYPSALIEFKKEIGGFNFDAEYAKNIKKEEKEAKKKK
mgnify:CR=1 FL=1